MLVVPEWIFNTISVQIYLISLVGFSACASVEGFGISSCSSLFRLVEKRNLDIGFNLEICDVTF